MRSAGRLFCGWREPPIRAAPSPEVAAPSPQTRAAFGAFAPRVGVSFGGHITRRTRIFQSSDRKCAVAYGRGRFALSGASAHEKLGRVPTVLRTAERPALVRIRC